VGYIMNLLTDEFISTTNGKVSLKQLLTGDQHYDLQYGFDEVQLAVLQLLSSLTTVLLKPTMRELSSYLELGLTAAQYEKALKSIDVNSFDADHFMRSVSSDKREVSTDKIAKLVSGIECGSSKNASGLFSDMSRVEKTCPHCAPVLNYNLHMNIKGECFGPAGATGIRGGGSLTTLISGTTLKQTLLANTVAVDFFMNLRGISTANDDLMWSNPPCDNIYYGHQIGLMRGLFALAYHIGFNELNEPCVCDICGHASETTIREFSRLRYLGRYGGTKTGQEAGAKWWPHPYTPTTKTVDGEFPVCAKGEGWQSWQGLVSYVVGKNIEGKNVIPAPIVQQYTAMGYGHANLLVGGNIADQGSVVGRVYDLYAMPQHWDASLERVTKVIDAGLEIKELLVQALNKLFGVGYDKSFVIGIKQQTVDQYTANAHSIIQGLLVDINRSEAKILRQKALTSLQKEALTLYRQLMRKYQNELPIFKALVKGERILARVTKVTN